MAAKHKTRRLTAGKRRSMADRGRLIADYEWLRRMMRLLDMQAEQVDRQLTELERLLPNDYTFPDNPRQG